MRCGTAREGARRRRGRRPRARRGCRRRAACRSAPPPPRATRRRSAARAVARRSRSRGRPPRGPGALRLRRGSSCAATPREPEHAHQVREDLQAVHQVAPGPDQVDLADRAEDDQPAVDPAVGQRRPAARGRTRGTARRSRPSRSASCSRTGRRRRPPPSRRRGDRRVEGRRAPPPCSVRPELPDAGDQDGQRADRRGHERDDEHLHHRVQPLLHAGRSLRAVP